MCSLSSCVCQWLNVAMAVAMARLFLMAFTSGLCDDASDSLWLSLPLAFHVRVLGVLSAGRRGREHRWSPKWSRRTRRVIFFNPRAWHTSISTLPLPSCWKWTHFKTLRLNFWIRNRHQIGSEEREQGSLPGANSNLHLVWVSGILRTLRQCSVETLRRSRLPLLLRQCLFFYWKFDHETLEDVSWI